MIVIWLALILEFFGIFGTSTNSVVLINETGLKLARVMIDRTKYEDVDFKNDKFIINVTPEKHDLELVFRGGTTIKWPDFDFKNIHEVTFELIKNRVNAKFE